VRTVGTTTTTLLETSDHLGNVRELLDSTGTVRARYDYDIYGKRTKVSGDLDSDFGFTGHYEHSVSSLTLAPFRAYDAVLGRWISRDPIEEAGGLNLYGYVGGNVVGAVDPLGWAEDLRFDPKNEQAAIDVPAIPGIFTIHTHGGGSGTKIQFPDGTLLPPELLVSTLKNLPSLPPSESERWSGRAISSMHSIFVHACNSGARNYIQVVADGMNMPTFGNAGLCSYLPKQTLTFEQWPREASRTSEDGVNLAFPSNWSDTDRARWITRVRAQGESVPKLLRDAVERAVSRMPPIHPRTWKEAK
jgi:RHS repeat-associated protein